MRGVPVHEHAQKSDEMKRNEKSGDDFEEKKTEERVSQSERADQTDQADDQLDERVDDVETRLVDGRQRQVLPAIGKVEGKGATDNMEEDCGESRLSKVGQSWAELGSDFSPRKICKMVWIISDSTYLLATHSRPTVSMSIHRTEVAFT